MCVRIDKLQIYFLDLVAQFHETKMVTCMTVHTTEAFGVDTSGNEQANL